MSELASKIIELHMLGKSYSQIKEELGCSKGTISYHLGAGQKEKAISRQRVIVSKIRRYLQEVKQSTPCVDCNENYPYWIMEFDHLSDKEFMINKFKNTTTSLERVREEVAKCEVVCANCHKNRTYVRLLRTNSGTLDLSEFYE